MRKNWVVKGAGMLACGLAMLTLTVGPARAADDKVLEQLKARLDALEQQNKDLTEKIKSAGPYQPVYQESPAPKDDKEKEKINKQVDAYLKEKDAKKKAEETAKTAAKEAEGYEVGKQLDVKGKWTNSQLWFETEDKAFRFHVGGRTQIDYVGVHAPKKVMAIEPTGPNSGGTGAGGIGEYDNGVNFRRARFAMEGTLFEVFDFNCEYDFINTTRDVPGGTTPAVAGPGFATNADRANVFNSPVPTDMWMQWKKIPFIGTVRVGNQKPWNSFEHQTSSRYLDFLERSVAFDAFLENGNNGFSPGVSVFNQFLDQKLSFAAGVYAPNKRDIFGWNVGDGEMQVTTRVWGTPIYENNGRCMLHMGMSYTHSTADDDVLRYRARSQLRNGPAALHNIIAIIQTNARSENLVNTEIALNVGPFSLSAEYYGNWTFGRSGQAITNAAGQNLSAATPAGGYRQLFYQGGYVTAGYFLTGEHRAYSRANGSWDRQPVNEYAFAVDGDEGMLFGRGAWQVVGRYSYLDLEDKGINGGVINEGTIGLNWFLNPNTKLQFNYDLAYRDVTRYNANGTVPIGGATLRDGIIQGAGTRLAFDF